MRWFWLKQGKLPNVLIFRKANNGGARDCKGASHRFSRWSEPEALEQATFKYGVKIPDSEHIRWRQSRACLDCNLMERRWIQSED